jgi:hypothetical protein
MPPLLRRSCVFNVAKIPTNSAKTTNGLSRSRIASQDFLCIFLYEVHFVKGPELGTSEDSVITSPKNERASRPQLAVSCAQVSTRTPIINYGRPPLSSGRGRSDISSSSAEVKREFLETVDCTAKHFNLLLVLVSWLAWVISEGCNMF